MKLENFSLKHNAMQREMTANLAARAAFIQGIEAAHPGYRWTEEEGLVAVRWTEDVAVETKPD